MVNTYDRDGITLIDKMGTFTMTIIMTDVPTVTQMAATPYSYRNGDITTYLFTFVSPLDIKGNDNI